MPREHSLNRRQFVTAAASGALALAGCSAADRLAAPLTKVHSGSFDLSKVQHLVMVMMENRSFDHYLGWLPGADGKQAGLSYSDNDGNTLSTYQLAPDFQGCGLTDPDHSFEGGRIEYAGGACDGWLKAQNDRFALGYYTQADLAFLGRAASDWTTCDRYFSSIMAETYPNRMYQHCAQTDRLTNTLSLSTLPTIWDRLEDAGVSRQYYYSNIPFLALWGAKYIGISSGISQFYSDCATGSLPAVSFVEPTFGGSTFGSGGNDDHPFSDIRAGQYFLNQVYQAVTTSPAWASTVLVITYDEWGGFFEHVAPPTGSTTPAEQGLGYTDGLLGFRVPTLIVSPFAGRGVVPHDSLEHSSVLRLIEERWNLTPLTQRDANATSLGDVLLDIKHGDKKPKPPVYSVPNITSGTCPSSASGRAASRSVGPVDWSGLRELASQHGWRVG